MVPVIPILKQGWYYKLRWISENPKSARELSGSARELSGS